MRAKTYKMRGLAVAKGKTRFIELHVEFEGRRAFVVWDSVLVGAFELKARLEIDPGLLERTKGRGCDFVYQGALELPRPENN